MTFKDLPPSWGDHPVTPELLPDVVDLFVSEHDRVCGCLVLLLLDADHRLLQPIVVGDVPLHTGPTGGEEFFDQLAQMVSDDDGHVVVARGRRGGEDLTVDDEDWRAACSRAFGERLVAMFVAAPGVVRRMPPAARAA